MQISKKELEYRKKIYYQNLNIQELNKKIDKLNKKLAIDDQQLNSKSLKLINGIRTSIFKARYYTKEKIKDAIKKHTKKNPYQIFDSYPLNLKKEESFLVKGLKTDVKPIAFYFPNLSEKYSHVSWSKIVNASPKNKNHFQPRVPHEDLGCYENSLTILKKQVNIAKQHGIYGFCYKYDFGYESNNDFLYKILKSNINMPFVLCLDINKKQFNSKKDIIEIALELSQFFKNKNYICQNNAPILLIYNPDVLINFSQDIKMLRKQFSNLGFKQILIWQNKRMDDMDQSYIEFVDGEFQYRLEEKYVCKKNEYNLYRYHDLVRQSSKLYRSHMSIVPYYYCCSLPIDTTPLGQNNPLINFDFSKDDFYFLMNEVLRKTRDTHDLSDRFMFVNSWNNWSEGLNIEPNTVQGYLYLNAFSHSIYGLPLKSNYLIINEKTPRQNKINKKIAIQIHLFYIDLIDEIISFLKNIPYEFDCYISTDTNLKKEIIENNFKKFGNCQKVIVECFENRGRDILPFLLQMKDVFTKYDYICHIHTKKTVTNNHGERWRKYLYQNLFGSTHFIQSLFYQFEENTKLGMIFPCIYSDVINDCTIGGNEKGISFLCKKLNISQSMIDKDNIDFPAGSMFWCKTDAIRDLLSLGLNQNDFPKEKHQVDATLAHAIERMFCVIVKHNGYDFLQVRNGTNTEVDDL